MSKWDKFLEEEEVTPFQKFDKSKRVGRRALKRGDDISKEKKQREREIDEKRIAKRGDEV